MREVTIGTRRIADDEPAYVIAELGHNHGGSLYTARAMIQSAAECGVHAVKLQKRHNETLYTPELLNAPYDNENSYGATYGAHREALEFEQDDYLACRFVAQQEHVDFFATAFDEDSADFLMTIGVPAIKIPSGGLADVALLRHVGSLGVPVIVSTGGGDWNDVERAASTLANASSPFAFLHCTAAYPVLDYAELNLSVIAEMRCRYPNIVIGWSGHDVGIAMAVMAYSFGARIIEKHFTLNRASKGTDHAFSLEPVGMRKMCRDLRRAHLAKGDGVKRWYDSERKPIAKMRRVETALGLRVTGVVPHERQGHSGRTRRRDLAAEASG